ncbi:lysophospholipid acyltransferase family protein [Gracilimonas mengyeensis]|uniref:Lyso-ornithine lipid acyltransferase n=1 Tax=Gracilimonas mengyeensis TaxID=1302730 RepID=A0A521DGL9_9BACT|nr:1-acyl-sn-glycerol-3-phosphate acyltransferase [Gracilimonas mengyeensis]SMO70867.1 lyso-ornithine lipid acyltransferase [Gracilimonas mengyeensis]
MRKIRATLRLIGLLIFTLTSFSIYAIGLVVPKLFRLPYEPWRNQFMRSWSRGVAIIFNMKMTVKGTPPQSPFFLVSNHLSYLDIVPLFLNLRCTFVAKKAVRSWPMLGFMVNAVGVIFVDRGRRGDVKRVNEVLSQSMNKYQGLIVFPEGTSSGGEEVLPFHASLLKYPASAEIPVHTAAISYRTKEGDEPARDSVCFFGARHSFPQHVWKLAQTRRVYCTIRFGEQTVQSANRKELAAKLRDKVQDIFEPTSPALQ